MSHSNLHVSCTAIHCLHAGQTSQRASSTPDKAATSADLAVKIAVESSPKDIDWFHLWRTPRYLTRLLSLIIIIFDSGTLNGKQCTPRGESLIRRSSIHIQYSLYSSFCSLLIGFDIESEFRREL